MESDADDNAMVVEEIVVDHPEEEGEEDGGDALGDEHEELSLVRRLQQARGLARQVQQHHPGLDDDTEEEDAALGHGAAATASASASAPGGGAGAAGSGGGSGREGPSEAVRAALRALRHGAPAVELVPLLVAAQEKLLAYLFRCPVPHKVSLYLSFGPSLMTHPSTTHSSFHHSLSPNRRFP